MDNLMAALKNELLLESYDNSFGETSLSDWTVGDREMTIRAIMRKWQWTDQGRPYEDTLNYTDVMIGANEIVDYSIGEQNGASGFDIGSVISAAYRLSIDNTQHRYTPADFTNTRFAVAIGIRIPGQPGIAYEPFGVWSVTDVSAPEQSTTAEISGMDALGTDFENTFYPFTGDEDAIVISYASIRAMLNAIALITLDPAEIIINYESEDDEEGTEEVYNYRYEWAIQDSRHNLLSFLDGEVPDTMYMLCSSGNTTMRQVISWIASTLGCFVRMSRNGDMLFKAYDKSYNGVNPAEITTSSYFTFTPLGVESFAYNRLMAKYYKDNNTENEAVVTRFVDNYIQQAPSNTIQLGSNPFMSTARSLAIHNLFKTNMTSDAVSLLFPGAPVVNIGDHYYVRDLNDEQHKIIINSMTSTFNGGLGQTISCSLPSNSTQYSASYNSNQSMQTALDNLAHAGTGQYSTEEQIIGARWVDNKPLYRRLVVWPEHYSRTGGPIYLGIDVDFVTIVWAIVHIDKEGSTPVNQWWPPFYINSGNYAYFGINGNESTIAMRLGTNYATCGKGAWVLIEYTKSTDNARTIWVSSDNNGAVVLAEDVSGSFTFTYDGSGAITVTAMPSSLSVAESDGFVIIG